jgi:hypothetical protein
MGELPFRYKVQHSDSKDFSGPIWFDCVIKEYKSKTNISENSLKEVDSLIIDFKKMTKIKQYTQRVQGSKK